MIIVSSTMRMHQGAAGDKHHLGQGQQDHLHILYVGQHD